MNVVISFSTSTGTGVPHHRIPNPNRFQIARPIIRIQSSSAATPIVKVITGHSGVLVLRAHCPQSVSLILCSSPLTSLRQGDFPRLASPRRPATSLGLLRLRGLFQLRPLPHLPLLGFGVCLP